MNTYNTNPIVLDTFTSDIDIGKILYNNTNIPFKIVSIEWINPELDGTSAIIRDGSNNVIFNETCFIPQVSITKYYNINILGIKVNAGDVPSGKILILIN